MRLPLARLPLDLLIVLVEREGQLVTREELANLLWGEKATLVDTQAGLNNAINRLRSLLNDDAQHPRYIETVFGKGYRFVAASLAHEADLPAATALVTPEPLPEQTSPPKYPPKLQEAKTIINGRPVIFWLTATAILISFGAWRFLSGSKANSEPFRAEQITTNDGDNRVNVAAISPSGQTVVYSDASGIFARTLRDGMVHILNFPTDLYAESIAWSADDDAVFVGGFRKTEAQWQIWRFRLLAGAGQKVVLNGRHPAVSPNGEHLAFTNENESDIQVSESDGVNRRLFAGQKKNTRILSLAWSDINSRIFSLEEARNHGFNPVDHPEMELHFSKRCVSRIFPDGQVTAEHKADQFDSLASSSDGKLYLLSSHMWKDGSNSLGIWSVETDHQTGAFASSPVLMVPSPDHTLTSLSLSRDGTRIATVLEKGEADVYLTDSQIRPIQNRRRLTLDSRRDFPNGWTPDSKAVIFESDRSGRFHIYRQGMDSPTPELLTDMAGEQVFSTPTPDGRWILFRQMSGDRVKTWKGLYRIPIEGGASIKIQTERASAEVRCPKIGAVCVTRTVVANRPIRFSALDYLTGAERLLAETPWVPVVPGDWDLAPDGSAVALPGHALDQPEIRIVSLNSKSALRVVAVKSPGQLWGLHWDNTGFGWLAEIRINDAHLLAHIDAAGRVEELYRTAYNTWALPSPDGRKLAYLDYTTDRNVWLWKR